MPMDLKRVDDLLYGLTELVGSAMVGPYMVPIGGMVKRAWPDEPTAPDDEKGGELIKDPKPPYADQYFSAPNSMIRTMDSPRERQPKRILVLLSSNQRRKPKKK